MHSTKITENWNEQKHKLKEKFDTLTSANKEELFNRLQSKLGKSKEELQAIITIN